MSKKRNKLKSVSAVPKKAGNTVHDRRAADLPYNARIAVVTVDDPFGFRDFATDAPAERTSGLRTGNTAATELRATAQPKVQVIVSLRDNPLRTLYVRGHLSDLQWDAGRRYRDDIDTAVIGGARAIDYSRPAVDGGRLGDPLGDSVSAAMDRLAYADSTLNRAKDATINRHGVPLCRAVIETGLSVADYARIVGADTKHGMKKMADLFRSCLDILAEVYGLATRRAA